MVFVITQRHFKLQLLDYCTVFYYYYQTRLNCSEHRCSTFESRLCKHCNKFPFV